MHVDNRFPDIFAGIYIRKGLPSVSAHLLMSFHLLYHQQSMDAAAAPATYNIVVVFIFFLCCIYIPPSNVEDGSSGFCCHHKPKLFRLAQQRIIRGIEQFAAIFKKKKTFVLYQRLFSSSLYTYTSNGMRFIIYAKKKIKKKMLFY